MSDSVLPNLLFGIENNFQRIHHCHIFYIKSLVSKFDLAENRSMPNSW